MKYFGMFHFCKFTAVGKFKIINTKAHSTCLALINNHVNCERITWNKLGSEKLNRLAFEIICLNTTRKILYCDTCILIF